LEKSWKGEERTTYTHRERLLTCPTSPLLYDHAMPFRLRGCAIMVDVLLTFRVRQQLAS